MTTTQAQFVTEEMMNKKCFWKKNERCAYQELWKSYERVWVQKKEKHKKIRENSRRVFEKLSEVMWNKVVVSENEMELWKVKSLRDDWYEKEVVRNVEDQWKRDATVFSIRSMRKTSMTKL